MCEAHICVCPMTSMCEEDEIVVGTIFHIYFLSDVCKVVKVNEKNSKTLNQSMDHIRDAFTDNAEDRKLVRTVSVRPGEVITANQHLGRLVHM